MTDTPTRVPGGRSEHLTFERDGEVLSVIGELSDEVFGSLDIEPLWFEADGRWRTDPESNRSTLTVIAHPGFIPEDESAAPPRERFVVELTVRRVED